MGTWSAPDIPLKVEYAVDLMEEVRAFVCDELQQLSRGDMEAGGVLFGQRREGSIRITDLAPVFTPAFARIGAAGSRRRIV